MIPSCSSAFKIVILTRQLVYMAIRKDKKTQQSSKIADDKNVDYSKDPFFIKKNAKAAAVLKKHGIPAHWLKK
jgi:hypothetical protein